MGLIGSSIFSSWRGFRTAPTGRVLRNMWREVSAKAPLRGAQFAAWGGTYSAFDCILASLRKKVVGLGDWRIGAASLRLTPPAFSG